MPATDAFSSSSNTATGPLEGGFAITPHDSDELPHVTRQIYAATAGDVAVVWRNGAESVEPIAAGERVDWRVRRVKATGTTATGLRGYW